MWSTLNTEVSGVDPDLKYFECRLSGGQLGVKYSEHRVNGVELDMDPELP